jgi:NTE family protein
LVDERGEVAEEKFRMEREPEATSEEQFGVPQKIQELLSHVRTDLDSFTQIEAYSLMLDGYRMSKVTLAGNSRIKKLASATVTQAGWQFGGIDSWIGREDSFYLKHLKVAGGRVFKVFKLRGWLAILTALILAVFLIFACAVFKGLIGDLLAWRMSIGHLLLGLIIVGGLAGLALTRPSNDFLFQLHRAARLVLRIIWPVILALPAWIVSWIHLRVFDCLFKSAGSLDKLAKRSRAQRVRQSDAE